MSDRITAASSAPGSLVLILDPFDSLENVSYFRMIISAAFAISLWDWLCLLPFEYTMVWKKLFKERKITLAASFYFFTRYLTLILFGISTGRSISFFGSVKECESWNKVLIFLSMFVTWAAEAVMALRCWNVWLRNNSIGILMIILMLSEISVMSLMAIKRLSDKEYFVVVDGAVSCIPMGKSFGIRWIIMLSTPVIVTALIFIISAIGILRVRQTVGNSAFLSKLAKDGLLYVGLSLTIYSTTLIAFITGGNILKASGSSISFLLPATMVSRLILKQQSIVSKEENSTDQGSRKTLWERPITEKS